MLHGRLWLREEHIDVSKPGIMRIRGKNTLIPTGKAQKRRAFPPKKIAKFQKYRKGSRKCLNCGKTWRLPAKSRFDTHLKTL
ncbi:hypothetical protein DXF96_07275 [Heyndrickxia coagulans]|nr:hypothetical protein BIZ35_15760 [Heyndrickxia coagulans]AWP35807.1 hypothetical protein CYJ15_01710 [Heyndrickxia coagulans]QDI61304.1 hypothetical protein DXF96_07275 [Heyndrickxia coagulans]